MPKRKKPKPPPPTQPPPPEPPPPTTGSRIVIDPITRIEGHLRIEVEVAGGKVASAWSSGTLFRGVETILKGRNPEEAWLFTQRLCGVCTYVHGSTSVRCVEDALHLQVPANARIVRNLLMGAQFLHDHIVHFYHLHALDWVDVTRALDASPAAAAAMSSPNAPVIDFASVQSRLRTFVESGQLGPFANGYWGHPEFKLSPEENLLLTGHYFAALHQQARTARLHAIFGGKNPHVQSLRVGGVTCGRDISTQRVAEFRAILDETKRFIDTVYIPDVKLLATRYPEWGQLGGSSNFLVFGEFPEGEREPDTLFFPRGAIIDGVLQGRGVDLTQVTEHVRHSWYQGNAALNPAAGVTQPLYNGLDTADRYSWLKAPRYQNRPMEVGPLARMLVAYESRAAGASDAISDFIVSTGLTLNEVNSSLGRTAARALETGIIANAMYRWLDELTYGGATRNSWSMPVQASGVGLNEAPRGALGHWIEIQNQQIGNYQMVVPSTWNFGPRDANDLPGPVEQALVGTPVADPAQPLEVLRTIHSFDPCLACAVHVIDTARDRAYTVRLM